MAHDARAVANLLLDVADLHGLVLTHMAVHKLAYFAHGWHLVAKDRPLVSRAFEAWKYGPMLRPVWDEFKQAGDRPIIGRATVLDYETGEVITATSDFVDEERSLVSDILRAYGRFPATRLSTMTHRKGGAWQKIWTSERVVLGMRIPDALIKEDFLSSNLDEPVKPS